MLRLPPEDVNPQRHSEETRVHSAGQILPNNAVAPSPIQNLEISAEALGN